MFERRLALPQLLLVCLSPVSLGLLRPSLVSAQVMQPMCVSGCITYNVDVPNIASKTWGPNTSGHTASFQVWNKGSSADEYWLSCSRTSPVTSCSVSVEDIVLDGGEKQSVTVTYSVGSPGTGSITLTADGTGDDDSGMGTVYVVGPPTINLASPGSGSSVAVHDRQPIIRAYFTLPAGDHVDTARTILTWDGDTITARDGLRHNRGLLEWEVDSTHWLTAGLPGHAHADTAVIVLKACGIVGGCTTATRSVILSDATPILGFSGVPLGRANGGYSAPFGPGLTLMGADVATGFSTRSRTTLGRARSVGLIYSTRTSYPRVLVPVDLDIPWPATTPSSITVRLKDGAVVKDTLKLTSPNTSCLTGTIRRCRVTLQADYSASTQTVVRKWLTVEATVITDQVRTSSDSVEVVIVDRRQSPYGSGWWPTMYTQLVKAGNDRILVSASGAASIYRGNGDTLFIPPPGSFTSITYTGLHELRTRGSTAYQTFDIYGRVTFVVDPSGNQDYITYDGTSDRLRWRIDPSGQRDSVVFDGNGLLSLIMGPEGRRDSVTINATTHQLTRRRITSPSSRPDIVTYAYQAYPGTYTNLLLRRMGTIGDTTRVVYDSTFRRRPVQVVLPKVVNENGNQVTPTFSYTAYERQGWGALRSLDSLYVEMKDPLNHWIRSLLNRWAEPLETWDALGLMSRSAYAPDGLELWSEGKSGDSSRVYTAYDQYRRVVRTYIMRGAASGPSVLRIDSLIYDANSRAMRRIDSRGLSTFYTYDAAGRPTMVRTSTGAGEDTVRAWYGTKGLVDSTKSSTVSGGATRFAYDTITWNVVRVLSNTGDTLVIKGYDDWGREVSRVSRAQVALSGTLSTWQWTKDTTTYGEDNLIEATTSIKSHTSTSPNWNPVFDPPDTTNSIRSSFVYDSAGRMVGRLNNRGKRTSYSYDLLGRATARRPWADSAAVKDTLFYDVAGNLKKVITRRGITITHYYDSRNRDTLTAFPGVGDLKHAYNGPQDEVTRIWLANAVDSIGGVNGEVRYGYDSRGRLRADTAYTGSAPRVTTHTYDVYERPSSTTNALGTWIVKYETARGLADTLITPMADTVVSLIDAKGQLESRVILSGGSRDSLHLDYKWNFGLNEMTHQVLAGSGYVSGRFERMPQDTGTLALSPTWQQQLGAGTATQTLNDSTIYDGWGRLTHWAATLNGVVKQSADYTFDATGNLRAAGSTWSYDAATDRLTLLVTGGATHHYKYDRSGNLVTDSMPGGPVWHYGYDAADRLVSARRDGVLIARYGYDVLGRRIVKRVYSSVSGGQYGYLRMVYNGRDVSFEADSAGTIGLKYTWGPGSDNLLAIEDGAGNHYYVTGDRLGSVRSLADRNGAWLLTRRWNPYGTEISRDSSAHFTWGGRLRYGWTGREYDAETGLYFHRARFYSTTQHRFTQEDPIGYAGGNNLYGYVGGSPLERRDPSGHNYMNVCGWQGYLYHWRSGRITHGYEFECHDVWVPGGSDDAGGGGGGGSGEAPGMEAPAPQLDPEICDSIRNSPGFRQTVKELRDAQKLAVSIGIGYVPETGGATDKDFNLMEDVRIGWPGSVEKKVLASEPRCPQCRTPLTFDTEGHVSFASPPTPSGAAWLVHLHLKHVELNPGDIRGFELSGATTGVISILDNGFNVATTGQTDLDQVHCSLK